MEIVILGLSITSSWGNGHATTYRSLIKGLHERGHSVHFLERDVPWYANNRDTRSFNYCRTSLYASTDELKRSFKSDIENASLVVVGSYVPDGVKVGEWVLENAGGITAFYDIDTPITVAKLEEEDYEYLNPDLISKYDLYLSFSGGPVLDIFTSRFGSPKALPLYCSVDPGFYYPEPVVNKWDLGYLGTYSDDRQPPLKKLLIDAARQWAPGRFVVAGPQYPATIAWPSNVQRFEHLPPAKHRQFFNEQRFTLNITRRDMIKMGYSPSVRLFEAAACAIPVISDWWEGLNGFFLPGEEILVAESPVDTLHYLKEISEKERIMIGERARQKVLKEHTGSRRAEELEKYVEQIQKQRLVV